MVVHLSPEHNLYADTVNVDKLQDASRKYDPDGLFQKGVPGGWRLFARVDQSKHGGQRIRRLSSGRCKKVKCYVTLVISTSLKAQERYLGI